MPNEHFVLPLNSQANTIDGLLDGLQEQSELSGKGVFFGADIRVTPEEIKVEIRNRFEALWSENASLKTNMAIAAEGCNEIRRYLDLPPKAVAALTNAAAQTTKPATRRNGPVDGQRGEAD